MDISPGWITAGISACCAVSAGAAAYVKITVKAEFSEEIEKRDKLIGEHAGKLAVAATSHIAQAAIIEGLRANVKVLFERLDAVRTDHEHYKVYIAENYVNREVLKEQLGPINESLKEIRKDLQDSRK